MQTQDSASHSAAVNPLLPGIRIYAVIGFCDIHHFEDINQLNQWQYNNSIEENVILEEFWPRNNLYPSFNHVTGYLQYQGFLEKPIKGLEKAYNTLLEGKIITHKIFMDTHQNIINSYKEGDYISGKNLHTTLFIKGQLYAEQLFKDFKGGIVVMNHRGEILVDFSAPILHTYDKTPIKNNYFLHKTLQEQYPPGSIFKIISLISLLQMNIPLETVTCTGYILIGNRKFHCVKRRSHGVIDNIYDAFKYSCNIFFYKNCYRMDNFLHQFYLNLQELGFNNTTQNILKEEISAKIKRPNNKMQTMLMSIGQGFANTTILQNCKMITSVMTGKKITPTFVKHHLPSSSLTISTEILKKLQECIRLTFTPGGTCGQLKKNGFDFFGKTGTAQVMSFKTSSDNPKKIYRKEHSVFVGGETNSQLYVSVLVENAGFGSSTAGVFAVKLLEFIIKNYPNTLPVKDD